MVPVAERTASPDAELTCQNRTAKL